MRQRVQKLVDSGVMQIVAVTDPDADRVRPPGHDRASRSPATSRRSPTSSPRSTRSTTSSSPPARSTCSPRWSSSDDDAPARAGQRPHPGDPRRDPHRDVPVPQARQADLQLGRALTARPTSEQRSDHHTDRDQLSDLRRRRAVGQGPRAPVDALHPAVVLRRTRRCRRSCAARAPTSSTSHGSATSTGWPGCSSCRPATAARNSPRPRTSRPSELAFFPLWSYAHPPAIELADRLAAYAPGDLNKVFFTTGGGEAVETAWKLAKQYFKLDRQADEAQGDQPHDRLPRHAAGRAVDHRHPGREEVLRAARARRAQGAEHQLLPRARARRRPRGVRPLGRRPDRRGDRDGGPGHRRRRVPRAGAELRRLLPAAARLLPAGARDLRPARRAAGLRRGHLRVRPAGHDVRLRQVRLRPRHHHLRQGHDQRLLPHRRLHRQRPDRRAVLERRRDSFPHGYTFGGHPVSARRRDGQPRHLRARGPQPARPAERGRVPRRRWRS